MKSSLDTKSLAEVCIKITDGSHFSPQAVSGDFMMTSSKDMTDHGWDYSDIKRISKEDYDQLVKSDCKPKLNDVLIIKDGNSYLQRVFAVKKEEQIVVLSSIAILRPDTKKIDPIYLQYLLKTNYIKEAASNFVTGAAIPRVILSDFKKVKIPYHPLPIQQQIASVLSTYDELIQTNNKRIKLLEETTRELYKEWFVRMRFPGYRKAKFVKGIPEGWKFDKIGNVTEIITRGISPLYDENGNSIVLNQKCIRDNKIDFEPARKQSKVIPISKLLRKGDILINSTGEGTLGRTAQLSRDIDLLTVDSHVSIVRAKADFSAEYLGLTIRSLEDYWEAMALGSTGQTELSRKSISDVTIKIPIRKLLSEFSLVISPINQQVDNLSEQNTRLRQIRDRLLPWLISGKLQVRVPSEAKVISINQAPLAFAAEAKSAYSNKKEPNPYFTRRVLAAYLIDKLHREVTFGHVKLMKLMYLCEHVAGIETASHYHRDAAGPYDNQMIRSIDSQLKKAKWFDCKNEKGKFVYYPLPKKEEYKQWFAKYYNHEQGGIDQLIELFGTKKTEEVEIVATLLEAHRHLVSVSVKASDDAVVHEVLNNWHESKKRIEEIRWRQGLVWMRQRNWIS